MFLTDRLGAWLGRLVSARQAAMVRVGIGTAALLKASILLPRAGAILAPGSLRAPWSEALPPASLLAVSGALGVWAAAAIAFVLGWRTRLAGAALSASIAFVVAADRHFYSNHLYLLLLLVVLLTVARSGEAVSFDHRRGAAGEDPIPGWPLDLVRLQVSLVYIFGALTKVNADFLSGSTLTATFSATPVGARLVEALGNAGVAAASAGTIGLELWLAAALWTSRVRGSAIAMGLLLHGGFLVLMEPRADLAVFGLVMLSSYVLFLRPEARSRLLVWDDLCDFCGGWARGIRALDWMHVHRYAGSSQPGILEEAGITRDEADAALQHVGPEGRAQGYDALRAALGLLPATFLIAPFLGLPGVRHLGRRAYRIVARRRRCLIPARAATSGAN